jgi:hypothetical protein
MGERYRRFGEVVSSGTSPEIVVLTGALAVPPETVDALVRRLAEDPALDAAGVLEPVLDAVKVVGDDDVVVGGVDRQDLGQLGLPLAVRNRALDPVTAEPDVTRLGLL